MTIDVSNLGKRNVLSLEIPATPLFSVPSRCAPCHCSQTHFPLLARYTEAQNRHVAGTRNLWPTRFSLKSVYMLTFVELWAVGSPKHFNPRRLRARGMQVLLQ
jgi:hypothetical protein